MANYPTQILEFREKTNLPGMVYDPLKKTTLYADDLIGIEAEVLAIENALGLEPYGLYPDVTARLNDVDVYLSAKQDTLQFTPEDVANKDTTATLGTSDIKYPSQKAVKAYVDNKITALVNTTWNQIGTSGKPAFQHSWVNYDAVNFTGAGYMKDSNGFVHLHGLVKSGTIGASIFTLPAGYRPALQCSFVCNSNSATGTINVINDGTVVPIVGSNVFFYLDGIIFLAEA